MRLRRQLGAVVKTPMGSWSLTFARPPPVGDLERLAATGQPPKDAAVSQPKKEPIDRIHSAGTLGWNAQRARSR